MKTLFKGLLVVVIFIFTVIGIATTVVVGYSMYLTNQIVAQIEEGEWANTTYWEDVITENIITEDI